MIAEQRIYGAATRDWGAAPQTLGWLTGATFLIASLLWLVTGGGYFWPCWIAFAGFLPISLMLLLPRAAQGGHGGSGPRGKLMLNAAVCSWLAVVLFLIWAFSGGGYYWPAI